MIKDILSSKILIFRLNYRKCSTLDTKKDIQPVKIIKGLVKNSVKLKSINLPTIKLPHIFRENLYDFYEIFDKRQLAKDADILSRFLRSRTTAFIDQSRRSAYPPPIVKSQKHSIKLISEELGLDKILDDYNNNFDNSLNNNRKNNKKQDRVAIVSYQPREAAAFAAARAPSVYGATYRVLNEIRTRDKNFNPLTVLDYGSGLGCATWAAHDIWGNSIKSYACVEVSDYMIDLSIRLNRYPDVDRDFINNINYSHHLPKNKKFDLVIASYTLTEFPAMEIRRRAVKALMELTNKYLVIVDHGNIDGFNAILAARKFIESAQNSFSESAQKNNFYSAHDQNNNDTQNFQKFSAHEHVDPAIKSKIDSAHNINIDSAQTNTNNFSQNKNLSAHDTNFVLAPKNNSSVHDHINQIPPKNINESAHDTNNSSESAHNNKFESAHDQTKNPALNKNNDSAQNPSPDSENESAHDDLNLFRQFSIFAPCPQDIFCPRSVRYGAKYFPCTFNQRVELAFYEGHRKHFGYSTEKFSYIILVKEPKSEESQIQRLVNEVTLFRGFIICEFCTKDCQIVQQNFSKAKDADVYKTLRKNVSNGDPIPLPDRKYTLQRRVVLPPGPENIHSIRQRLESLSKKIRYTQYLEKADVENNIILDDSNK